MTLTYDKNDYKKYEKTNNSDIDYISNMITSHNHNNIGRMTKSVTMTITVIIEFKITEMYDFFTYFVCHYFATMWIEMKSIVMTQYWQNDNNSNKSNNSNNSSHKIEYIDKNIRLSIIMKLIIVDL